MPTILLIRHGENDFVVTHRLAGRLPGVHLNARGHEQARQVAQTLAQAPIQAIYCSPLERALETATPLAETLKLEIQVRPGLSEINFGDWQGRTLKQLQRRTLWKFVQESPSRVRFPNGESFTEAQQRMVAAIEAIAQAHDAKTLIACVSHSDAIRLTLAHYLQVPLDGFQRLSVDTASISVLHLDGKNCRLGSINYHPLQFPKQED